MKKEELMSPSCLVEQASGLSQRASPPDALGLSTWACRIKPLHFRVFREGISWLRIQSDIPLNALMFVFSRFHGRGGKGIRKTRKNRKIGFGPFFNRNLLSINSFQLKQATGILRIIRNFLRVGVWGPLVGKAKC
jgi:hypothetical protein